MRFSSVALRVLLVSWLACDVHEAFAPPRVVVASTNNASPPTKGSDTNKNNLQRRRRGWSLYQKGSDKDGFFFGDMFKYQSSPESRAALGLDADEDKGEQPKEKKEELTPKPPEEPPSMEVMQDQTPETPPPTPKSEPKKMEPIELRPLMDEKTKQEMGKAAKVVKEKVVVSTYVLDVALYCIGRRFFHARCLHTELFTFL